MRTLIWIALRSLRNSALSSVVTVVSIGLASGLGIAVFAVAAQSERAFTGGHPSFDAVLGARGSALQLVLNAIFHLETSPGNIPWELYEKVAGDRRVTLALPLAVGDNYRGFRVVGTTDEVFEIEMAAGQRFSPRPGGRAFDPTLREAVVGATVAREAGLVEGQHFAPIHGVVHHDANEHEEEYLVVGVLEPTNTPSDRVIWIPIEGVFRMGGHVLRGAEETFVPKPGEAIPDEHLEVSAVLLRLKSPQAGFQLHNEFNVQGKEATLAWPIAQTMSELFDKLGWMSRVLHVVAYLVMAIAAGTILAGLSNSMNERRREFAVLRALGAPRRSVFGVILIQAGSLAFAGCLFGYLVYAVILVSAAQIVRRQTGVALEVFAFHPSLLWTPAWMTVLGVVAGILPGRKAYSTDVGTELVSEA